MNPYPWQAGGDEAREYARTTWEHGRVDFVLKQFRLQRFRKELLSRCDDSTTYKRLAFVHFNAVFPTFPMSLFADDLGEHIPLHKNQKTILPYWFKAFHTLPFAESIRQHINQQGEYARPVGLVFKRQGFQQGLVIHNGGEGFLPDKGSWFTFRTRLGKQIQTLHTLPFYVLLKQIQWSAPS